MWSVANGPIDKLRLPKRTPTENKPMCAAENHKGSRGGITEVQSFYFGI